MEENNVAPPISTRLSWNKARDAFAYMGVQLPENPPPETVLTAYRALDKLPPDLLAPLLNPGMSMNLNLPVVGRGEGGVIVPLRVGADVQFELAGKMSNPEIGPGLEVTQRVQATAEMQYGVSGGYGRTTVNNAYKWLDRFGMIPPEWKQEIENNPVGKGLLKGLGGPSVEAREYVGSRLTYEAVVTPEQGKLIDAGQMQAMPNPMDPLNMAAGTSVVIKGQDLVGSDFDASYKMRNVGGSTTRLEGAGFGVRRLEGNLVEVFAGDIATVENAAYVGFGPRRYASVRADFGDTLEGQKMSVARLDLGTAEGQEAYRQFMAGGGVPQQKGPGVPQVGQSAEYTLEQARALGITLGDAYIGFDNSTNNTLTLSDVRTGQQEIALTYRRDDGMVTQFTAPFDKDKRVGDAQRGSYSVVLPAVDGASANYLRQAFGGEFGNDREGLAGSQPLELKFNAEELMRLRDASRDYMAGQSRAGMSPEEIRSVYARLDAGEREAQLQVPRQGLIGNLAAASTPGEVLKAFQTYGSMDNIPTELHELYVSAPGPDRPPLPGGLEIKPSQEQLDQLKDMPAAERSAYLAEHYRFPPGADPAHALDAAATRDAATTLPAAAAQSADAPTTAAAKGADTSAVAPATLDRELMEKVRSGVREIDERSGKPWDERSERIAASAYAVAVDKHFVGSDEVKLALGRSAGGEDGAVLHVYRQGAGASPDPASNHGHVAVADALAVPAQERLRQAETQRQENLDPARTPPPANKSAEDPAPVAQSR